jgi:hypothetical protein
LLPPKYYWRYQIRDHEMDDILACIGKTRNAYSILVRSIKKKDNLGGLGVDKTVLI